MKRGVRNTFNTLGAIAGVVGGAVNTVNPLVSRPTGAKVLSQSKRPGRFPVEFSDSKGNKVIGHVWGKNSADAQKRAESGGIARRIATGRLFTRRL